MIRCPFCHFENEEGALFCEQCKSDLAGVEPAIPSVLPIEAAIPVAAAEVIETIPVVTVPEGMPVVEAILAEPLAAPFAGMPVEALAPIPLAPDVPPAPPSVPAMAPAMATMHAVAPAAAPPTMAGAAPLTPMPATAVTMPASQLAAAVGDAASALPSDSQPRLLVLRGLKRNVEYPVYEGLNFVGRADEKPVDIDLDDQEPPDRVWSSRQHALITFEGGKLQIEDLNSSNGTFVNRARIYPGQKRDLAVGDVVQIGTVQMKVIV